MTSLVTVSNGKQFFRVPGEQLAKARKLGFYRPAEKGCTIVSDGREILEIPLADVASAKGDGFRDVLASERPASQAASEGQQTAQSASQAEDAVSEYRQAELEQEAKLDELVRRSTESGFVGRIVARLQLTWFQWQEPVLRQLRTSGVSVALHVAILLILSTVLLVDESIISPDIITVSSATEDPIEEIIIEEVDFEIEEPVEEEVQEIDESMEVVSEVTEQFVSINVNDALDGSLLAAPAAKSSGDGEAMEKPAKAKVQFFGSKTEAINFVFVIDNSNSMTKGRFETALNELVKAVSKLSKRQKFFVIFYSDTAYPLFHPYPPKTLVPATTQNKVLLTKWLETVPLCLKTNGRKALQLGFSLNPDVMFVLGDGAFTDGASRFFSANPNRRVVVHTLGMEVSPKNAETFKMLAESHKGTYQDVGVHPQAALLAKQFPRMRNRARNGVWGLELPNVPKDKN